MVKNPQGTTAAFQVAPARLAALKSAPLRLHQHGLVLRVAPCHWNCSSLVIPANGSA